MMSCFQEIQGHCDMQTPQTLITRSVSKLQNQENSSKTDGQITEACL